AHQQYSGRAVADLGGVSGGVDSVLDDRPETGESFRGGFAKTSVTRHGRDLTGGLALLGHHRRLYRDDLAIEPAFGPRDRGALLRLEPQGVDVVTLDATLVGDPFGGGELVTHVDRPVVRI